MTYDNRDLEVVHANDVAIKDESNPTSIINLVPPALGERIRGIPDDMFLLGDEELAVAAKADVTENRLRHSFWIEYSRAQLRGTQMQMNNIYSGVCRREYFYHHVITNPAKLAFILTPPANYKVTLEELLTVGLEQLRDILKTPHKYKSKDKNGKPVDIVDGRLAAVKAKIVEELMNRARGPVIHKIESKSMNLNIDQKAKDVAETDVALKDIDAEIKALEERRKSQVNGIIDVTKKI